DLVAVGLGRAGRDATAVLAVALTMGTMNVYTSGAAKLVASLAQERALPVWFTGDAERSVPRRPLLAFALPAAPSFVAVIAGLGSTGALVRATSACFIAVYLLALASACRILDGWTRVAAFVSVALVIALAVFSSGYLLVPIVAAVLSLGVFR